MMSEVRKGPGVQEGRKPVEAEKGELLIPSWSHEENPALTAP